MIAALVVALALPAGGLDAAHAARLESDAFAALNDHRDCEAAALFLQAFGRSADDRMLFNAALAFQRGGDRAGALQAFRDVTDVTLVPQALAKGAALDKVIHAEGPGSPCRAQRNEEPLAEPSHAKVEPASEDKPVTAAVAESAVPTNASVGPPPLLPWAIAGLAGGGAVAIAGFSAFGFIDVPVMFDKTSLGTAKGLALGTTPAFIVAGSVGALVAVAGAVVLVVEGG